MDIINQKHLKMASIIRWFIFFLVFFFAIYVIFLHMTSHRGETTGNVYTCPMHPQYISETPGECPICGMTLVPSENKGSKANLNAGEVSEELYTCPMHPEVISYVEGRCPECGMRLVRRENTANDDHIGKDNFSSPTAHIPVDRLQLIGVTYDKVEIRDVPDNIDTFCQIEMDDLQIIKVHLRFSGFIEKVYKREGDYVRKGERIFSFFSPEIYQIEQEYIQMIGSKLTDGLEGLNDSPITRLQLLGIDKVEVERLKREKTIRQYIDFYSPINGFITKKYRYDKEAFVPSDPVVEVTDLSNVYLVASLFERDSSLVKKGDKIVFYPEAYSNKQYQGSISSVYPVLEGGLRVRKARAILKNEGYLLMVGMYGRCLIETGRRKILTVHRDAVVFGGEDNYVFRVAGDGLFEKKRVEIGRRYGNFIEIKSGLKEGDRVVMKGNFLIDSETSIQNAFRDHVNH